MNYLFEISRDPLQLTGFLSPDEELLSLASPWADTPSPELSVSVTPLPDLDFEPGFFRPIRTENEQIELSYEGFIITAKTIEDIVATHPFLEKLSFTNCSIFDQAELRQLKNIHSLTDLTLNNCELGDEAVEALATMTTLQSLDVSHNHMLSTILPLSDLSSLRMLNMYGCTISEREENQFLSRMKLKQSSFSIQSNCDARPASTLENKPLESYCSRIVKSVGTVLQAKTEDEVNARKDEHSKMLECASKELSLTPRTRFTRNFVVLRERSKDLDQLIEVYRAFVQSVEQEGFSARSIAAFRKAYSKHLLSHYLFDSFNDYKKEFAIYFIFAEMLGNLKESLTVFRDLLLPLLPTAVVEEVKNMDDTRFIIEKVFVNVVAKADYKYHQKAINTFFNTFTPKFPGLTTIRDAFQFTRSVAEQQVAVDASDLCKTALFIEANIPKWLQQDKSLYCKRELFRIPFDVEYIAKHCYVCVHLKDISYGHGLSKAVTISIIYELVEPVLAAHVVCCPDYKKLAEGGHDAQEATKRAWRDFEQEKQILEELMPLNLEGIIRAYAITEVIPIQSTKKECSFIEKLYTGGTLGRPQFDLTEADYKEIALATLTGLANLHKQGIAHNDLHKNQILLEKREDGTISAVISDFGRATKPQDDSKQELEVSRGEDDLVYKQLERIAWMDKRKNNYLYPIEFHKDVARLAELLAPKLIGKNIYTEKLKQQKERLILEKKSKMRKGLDRNEQVELVLLKMVAWPASQRISAQEALDEFGSVYANKA